MPRWERPQGWASQAVLPLHTASGPLYVVSLGEWDFLCGSSKSEGSEKQGVEASRLLRPSVSFTIFYWSKKSQSSPRFKGGEGLDSFF